MSRNENTGARLAAIKDISTERLIELAQAEVAGLVTISTSPSEIYQQAIAKEEGCRDGGVEMVIRELERLASLDLDLAKGTIGTRRTIEIIRETLPYLKAAAALLRTHQDAQPNGPLALGELKLILSTDDRPIWVSMDGDAWPAILDLLDGELVAVWGSGRTCVLREKDYETYWLAYLYPPKENKK